MQKLPGALVRRIDEDLLGIALLRDHALVHEHHAIGGLARKFHLVSDHDHRHSVARETAHHVGDFPDKFGIERRGRFIEEHDAGLDGKRPGNGDALLLSPDNWLG